MRPLKKKWRKANPRGNKKPADLSARLAFTKPELQRLFPFGHTTLEMAIQKGDFPAGVAPWPGAHKIWTLGMIREFLDELEILAGLKINPALAPEESAPARGAVK